jgi:phenol hydroxylase P1 protein
MEDWYTFTDPRQFYYGTYTQTRARQQDNADSSFKFVEKRALLDAVSDSNKAKVRDFLIPLRHTEWGANMNNCAITDEGYGVAITQVTMFNTIDRLGIAQYITRMSLLLESNDTSGLDAAKDAWMSNDAWQGLRKAVEDTFVLDDWFETLVAQNVIMDGLIYPLLFGRLVDEITASGATAVAMLTEFQNDWYAETVRWTDALLKVTAKESSANASLLSEWSEKWLQTIDDALAPIAAAAFGSDGKDHLQQVRQQLEERLTKQGIKV